MIAKIHWDTDGEEIDYLPTEVEVPNEMVGEDISNWLSDEYGWCIDNIVYN